MKQDIYNTISAISEGIYKEKGSKFLSFAYPIDNEEDVHSVLKDLKKRFYDARHYCYGFIIGADKSIYRAGDDGEPPNSAGPPILGQIRSKNLSNVLVVVVRYFGGTKLGVPGLINAYKTAAEDALKNALVIEKTVDSTLCVSFEYIEMDKIMKIVKDENLKITHQEFNLDCSVHVKVRMSNVETILKKFEKYGKVEIIY